MAADETTATVPGTGPAPHAEDSWPTSGRAGPAPVVIGDSGRAFTEVRPVLFADQWVQADTEIDGGSLGGLEVRAASLRGLSHRHQGTPRQDAYGFAVADGWFTAVVADGVSSGPLSHEAARLVARRGPEQVVRQLGAGRAPADIDWPEVFSVLAKLILRAGERSLTRSHITPAEGQSVDQAVVAAMATTATFVVCPTSAAGQREAAVAWMGDSPAWRLAADGGWQCLSEVKGAGAEVATSRVPALPMLPGDTVPSRVVTLAPDDVLLVMTDGVGDPLGGADGEVGRFLADVWRTPPDPLDFAAQTGFGRKSYDDDRTVVGVWPRLRER